MTDINNFENPITLSPKLLALALLGRELCLTYIATVILPQYDYDGNLIDRCKAQWTFNGDSNITSTSTSNNGGASSYRTVVVDKVEVVSTQVGKNSPEHIFSVMHDIIQRRPEFINLFLPERFISMQRYRVMKRASQRYLPVNGVLGGQGNFLVWPQIASVSAGLDGLGHRVTKSSDGKYVSTGRNGVRFMELCLYILIAFEV